MKSVYIAEGNIQKEEETLSYFKEFTGLTTREIEILALLVDNSRMIVEELARVTGFNYTTIKEILKNLENKGLVKSTLGKPIRVDSVPISEVA